MVPSCINLSERACTALRTGAKDHPDGQDPLFAGVFQLPWRLARYHSWAVKPDTVNGQLQVLAEDEQGVIMALRHREYPVYGVQFHPESVITDHGLQMMKNWLELPLPPPPQDPIPKADNMKAILNHLFEHQTLSREEAKEVLTNIAKGDKYNASQVAAFLTVYIMRGIRVEELAGFRDAMLELCIPVDLSDFDPIDLCGTGGDGRDTFNVSTLATFVTAGAGVPVAKHGNYGVSSVSGSSNVIEYYGGTFTNDHDHLRRKMEECNLCFLHAPLFHPAMKNVGPIRRELGVKTFFNMLGPMVNPAFVNKQLVGVFSLELARLYGYLYQKTDKQFSILHSLDGYDEISLTGGVKVLSNEGERLLQPNDLGLNQWLPEDLHGGKTVEEAARIFETVLKNEGTEAQRQVVIANAGMAIHTARGTDLADSLAAARESLESGKAYETFKKFIR
jgi:anthranilate phosphoribosyltransferase